MHKPHILFIEDEHLIREVIAEALVDTGCVVTEACDAGTALSLLGAENRFDLLLTDVHMPGDLNGIDIVFHARSIWPEIPVVFATGRPDILEMLDVPGPRPGCVAKPYALDDLLAVIQPILADDRRSK